MSRIPVPFQRFEIKSNLSPDEFVETLQREVQDSEFWCWECEDRFHLEIKRKFYLDLQRSKPSVHLRIRPETTGSVAEVRIQFGPFQGLVFFGLATVVVLVVIWSFFSFLLYGMDIRISLFAGLFLVSIYLFGTASFQMEAERAKKFLLKLFNSSGKHEFDERAEP